MSVGGAFNATLLDDNQVLYGHGVVSGTTNHNSINK